ncbi:hypothetical protein [Deinococcus yavapaiensis]|uniref:Uncharacterized protein n=1 Tax=Deinococcus yavapaiensis KR-236 TaxID=694435 RepID=A0A318S287_9DEIO|nr:hypothetical protein [Deinococcus yavapaiensis]PYE51947.1 hypothetical protein DES52_114148 [Deinococcus yavapaiensis KR-236]
MLSDVAELIERAWLSVMMCNDLDENTSAELLLLLEDVRAELKRARTERYERRLRSLVEFVLDEVELA